MNRTSTNNDIVKYIYNELEEQNTLQLNFKAITDNQVKDDISSFFEFIESIIIFNKNIIH